MGPETGNSLSDEHSELEPPDPIPNSEVKRCIADGSVGLPHVRVGHRQAPIPNTLIRNDQGVFLYKVEAYEFASTGPESEGFSRLLKRVLKRLKTSNKSLTEHKVSVEFAALVERKR